MEGIWKNKTWWVTFIVFLIIIFGGQMYILTHSFDLMLAVIVIAIDIIAAAVIVLMAKQSFFENKPKN